MTSTPGATTATPAGGDVVALLDQASTCVPAKEQMQGPYWFDVDSIRSDIREDRPGMPLTLAVRVQDLTPCSTGGAATPVANSVVEIWHCDAGGSYSGFESGSTGAGSGPGGPPPGGSSPGGAPGAPNPGGGAEPGGAAGNSGETSDGSYSVGDAEAETTDDGTYLRGAQVTDSSGIAQFTTIYPGWYAGRTTHIHCKVHIDKATVRTTQLFFDDTLTDRVYNASPYHEHTGRDTTNSADNIFDETGLLTVQPSDDGYLAVINLGIDA